MSDLHWTTMVHYQQQFQKLSRKLLCSKQQLLTTSECELLAWLYFHPEDNTPLKLSQNSGMKKEAVSRCLKNLYDKNCLQKKKRSSDERSYELFITDYGLSALKQGYEAILQPFYDLWRICGSEFEELLKRIDQIAELDITQKKEKTNELL